MEKAEKYFAPLLRMMQEKRNPAEAAAMKKYMRNKFDFFGLKQKPRREICKQFIDTYGLPAYDQLPEYVRYLWEQPERELQHFAMELVTRFLKQIDRDFLSLVEFMITHKSWWDTVDYIAAWHAGKYFKKFPDEISIVTRKWMDSENIWLQRSALLFQLKYKSETDFELMKSTIEELKDSKEFFIRKAIGWVLREYSKTDSAAVIAYVDHAGISNFSKTEALKWLKRRSLIRYSIQKS
ncbi:MAG: DNA alkylation repair protein [Bacteroidota bacterium]|nr:DNA alkylation repair protein [Bacteroidota bacterium]